MLTKAECAIANLDLCGFLSRRAEEARAKNPRPYVPPEPEPLTAEEAEEAAKIVSAKPSPDFDADAFCLRAVLVAGADPGAVPWESLPARLLPMREEFPREAWLARRG
jgi:hypothetical protein